MQITFEIDEETYEKIKKDAADENKTVEEYMSDYIHNVYNPEVEELSFR